MEEFPVNYTCLKSGKEVYASKIVSIDVVRDGPVSDSGKRNLNLEDGKIIKVSYQFMRDHGPKLGGYYIVEDDGDRRFKHAKHFEKEHAEIDHVPFDEGEEGFEEPAGDPDVVGVDLGTPEGDRSVGLNTEDNSGQGQGDSILDDDNATEDGGDVNA